MNTFNGNIKNYLFLCKVEDYHQELYTVYAFCFEKIKSGHLVLFISYKHFDFTNLADRMQLTGDDMRRLKTMYLDSFLTVRQKLLELYEWSLYPTMIIIDFCEHISNESLVIQNLAHCLACVFSYMQSITNLENIENSWSKFQSPFTSLHLLVVVKTVADTFSQMHVNLIKNLYFYNTELIESFQDLHLIM